MIFRQNSSGYSSAKNRHAEGKCIKEHSEVDELLSKFEQKLNHEKIDTPKVNTQEKTLKCMFFYPNSTKLRSQKNGYAKGNCITQNAKVDDDSCFFSEFRIA